EEDSSPVVHKVTALIRSPNSTAAAAAPMEEQLNNADFIYNEEIVENVLKRCFKVPHLAFRFFNWIKTRNEFRHTTRTYNAMISIAGEAGELASVEALLDEMKRNDCVVNMQTRTILLSLYGKAGMLAKSLILFEEMKKTGIQPDATAYRTMVIALCRNGQTELALEFYRAMVRNEMEVDLAVYKRLLQSLAFSGNVDAVRSIGEEMTKLSEIPESRAQSLMLKSLCTAGRIEESLELIGDAMNKGTALDDTATFGTLVKGLCRRNKIRDAMEIFEIMKKKGAVDENVYGILISEYLKRSRVFEASTLFDEAKKSGIVTSAATYTELMQHHFRKNEFQKGMDLYREMLETGIRPSSDAIASVAAGYVRKNRIREAWEVFRSANEKGIQPTSDGYLIFVDELCRASKTNEVLEALNEMQASEINIPQKMFKMIESYLEKKGEMQKLNSVKQMQRSFTFHPGVVEETGADFLRSDSRRKDRRRPSDHVPESMKRVEISPDAGEVSQILSSSTDWSLVREKLDKNSFTLKPDDVVEILQSCGLNIGIALKFFSWIDKKPGYFHNDKAYHMAMKIAGKGKNFKVMKYLFYEMKRRGCSVSPDTWTIMIMLYGRTGLTDIALGLFKEMKHSGCKPSKSTYRYLISSLCGKKGRKVDDAIKIYKEMIKRGHPIDKQLVGTYVTSLCEVNKLSEAKSCIESLPKFGFSIPLSYSLYIRGLCRAGKLDDALALIDKSGSVKAVLEQYTYGSLIHGFLRKGQLEKALAKMKYMMKQYGIPPTVHVYTALIIHFIKEREINRAIETLDEMKKEGCQPTVVTFSALVCGYVRTGQVEDAWNLFNELKQNGPLPDFKTYSMFIECLCKTGNSEDALKLIDEMVEDGMSPSTINFREIIWGLNREDKPELAKVVLSRKLDLKRRRTV
ncbi:hypothetical protein M569_10945, partial [Genlisea aurea]